MWEYRGVNTLSKHGEDGNLLAMHPTVKPVQLIKGRAWIYGIGIIAIAIVALWKFFVR